MGEIRFRKASSESVQIEINLSIARQYRAANIGRSFYLYSSAFPSYKMAKFAPKTKAKCSD
jgi:hypothetical protein